MDTSRALGTEFREVREVEQEGKPARAVEGSRFYSTETDDLWDALTNAERIPRWFLPIRGDLRLGGRYHLEGNAEGTITRCDPPQALRRHLGVRRPRELGECTGWCRRTTAHV